MIQTKLQNQKPIGQFYDDNYKPINRATAKQPIVNQPKRDRAENIILLKNIIEKGSEFMQMLSNIKSEMGNTQVNNLSDQKLNQIIDNCLKIAKKNKLV